MVYWPSVPIEEPPTKYGLSVKHNDTSVTPKYHVFCSSLIPLCSLCYHHGHFIGVTVYLGSSPRTRLLNKEQKAQERMIPKGRNRKISLFINNIIVRTLCHFILIILYSLIE